MSSARSPSLDIAVLTAGASRRLGQPKQLIDLNGQILLVRALDAARSLCTLMNSVRQPLVISGAYLQEDCKALHTAGLSEHVQHHFNSRWTEGLPTSVALARQHSDGDGLLVMLVDQYRVRAEDLARLYDTWKHQPGRPCAASFNDTLGPPVIWPREARLPGLPDKATLLALEPTSTPIQSAAFDLDTERDLADARAHVRPTDQPI